MGGCSAINCSNHSRKGYRMFSFPKNINRRKLWTINCQRDGWTPGTGAALCIEHFEESQFEQNRSDNWKKLKRDAVPTIFNIPKPPPTTIGEFPYRRMKGIGCPMPCTFLVSHQNESGKIHFEENQFELHRQDGWKKLKPNAIPTLFPEPAETPKTKKEKSTVSRKRKSSPSKEIEVSPKKRVYRKKTQESSSKKKKFSKKSKSKSRAVQKKKRGSLENSHNDTPKRKQGSAESTQNSQKENVSPRFRKCKSPSRALPQLSDSSTEEEYEEEEYEEEEEEEEESEDEAQQQIALLKRENESMKQEISEFEKHNKAMARVILELEKHNKLMSLKLTELDKDNKVLNKKISDLERLNEDLKSKLNQSFSEEQLARMDKMRQLGTIERYIPALK